ncbi:MAG: flavin reductase [Oscillospiraceae bacterium]
MINFKKINTSSLSLNPFESISKEWFLVTAGDKSNFNTMTASWGSVGHLWNLDVFFSFVRPQRHTFSFCEENLYYSICFFDEQYKKDLVFCGRNSGANTDKIKNTNLTPVFDENETPFFKESNLVFICKKLYVDRLKEDSFLNSDLSIKNYPKKDFHQMYVGEIISVLVPND